MNRFLGRLWWVGIAACFLAPSLPAQVSLGAGAVGTGICRSFRRSNSAALKRLSNRRKTRNPIRHRRPPVLRPQISKLTRLREVIQLRFGAASQAHVWNDS